MRYQYDLLRSYYDQSVGSRWTWMFKMQLNAAHFLHTMHSDRIYRRYDVATVYTEGMLVYRKHDSDRRSKEGTLVHCKHDSGRIYKEGLLAIGTVDTERVLLADTKKGSSRIGETRVETLNPKPYSLISYP